MQLLNEIVDYLYSIHALNDEDVQFLVGKGFCKKELFDEYEDSFNARSARYKLQLEKEKLEEELAKKDGALEHQIDKTIDERHRKQGRRGEKKRDTHGKSRKRLYSSRIAKKREICCYTITNDLIKTNFEKTFTKSNLVVLQAMVGLYYPSKVEFKTALNKKANNSGDVEIHKHLEYICTVAKTPFSLPNCIAQYNESYLLPRTFNQLKNSNFIKTTEDGLFFIENPSKKYSIHYCDADKLSQEDLFRLNNMNHMELIGNRFFLRCSTEEKLFHLCEINRKLVHTIK